MNLLKPLGVWFGISVLVIALDQWTKVWADHALAMGREIIIFSWFKLQLAYNTGAAFSFLHDASGWQKYFFAGLAIVVSGVLTFWIVRTVVRREQGRWCELLALSLILGGALGNVYDRITLGHVIDFIVWHYQDHYFPTFNIADSAICTGAGLLILDMLFLQKKNTDKVVTES